MLRITKMVNMKKFLLILMFLAPISIMAHEGHGIYGNEILHLFVSHYYAAIGMLAIVGLSFYYRKRVKSKK
jgi:hypothetical protein